MKIPKIVGQYKVIPYSAEVVSVFNYYAFGMLMPGMYSTGSANYRFGFNGMIRDDDVKEKISTVPPMNEGIGNSYSTEFRMYDPRVGRWLSSDPLAQKFPSLSPFIGMGNNPILFTDVRGDSIFSYGDQTSNMVKGLTKKYGKELSINFSSLNNCDQLNISKNSNFKGTLSDAAASLIEASNSQSANVNIFGLSADNANVAYDEKDRLCRISIGLFGGNYPSLNDTKIKEGLQYLDYNLIVELEKNDIYQT